MIFNSLEFAFFLPIVFLVYWFVVNKHLRYQNMWLLAASYFFYGWWDWRFLSLIVFSSFVDYFVGLRLGKEEDPQQRKFLLWISIFVNLGFLGVFKYFNFFAESFAEAFTLMGITFDPVRLNIILPIGISFYTFQTLSYSFDIYQKKLAPTKDIIGFFAFVSFFPQLVAGPIERATNLLPQFHKNRVFKHDLAVDGMRQILWGLFKKVVIADNCAVFVNGAFENYQDLSGNHLFSAAVFFAIQIYCDFSGYSDIAIGTARLFGFSLMKNFSTPYFSTSTAELWRNWHISLSKYANDYCFIPLSLWFAGKTKSAVSLSLFFTFVIIGLWHGANWTFILFGVWNGMLVVIEHLTTRRRNKLKRKYDKRLFNFFGWGITLFCWLIGMIIFRAENIGHAIDYIYRLFTNLHLGVPPIYKLREAA